MNNETISTLQNNLSRTVLPVEESERGQDTQHAHPPPQDQEDLQTKIFTKLTHNDPTWECFLVYQPGENTDTHT